MKLSHFFAISLTLIALGLPIYGIIKKVRMKLPIFAGSGMSTALAVLATLASADMTIDKIQKSKVVEEMYPLWENFYRMSTVIFIIAISLNIYFLAREVRD